MSTLVKIYVNKIEVGTMPIDQYESVVKQASLNWTLYVLQAFNVIGVLARIALAAFRQIPFFWFLIATAAAVWEPSLIDSVATELPKATHTQISQVFLTLVTSSTLFIGGLLVFRAFFSGAISKPSNGFGTYGYTNLIQREINYRLREVMEVPAEGEIHVSFWNYAEPAYEQ